MAARTGREWPVPRRSLLSRLGPEDGMALFDEALRTGRPALVPMHLGARTTADEVPSVLRDLIQPARRAVSAEPAAAPLPERLSSLSEPAATELLLAMVRDTAAAALGHSDLAAIDADGAFWDVGFSSLIAVEFRNRLGELTGVRLSAAIVYDQPTPRMLAEHLMARLRPVTADLV
jgi:hypothetical protein